MFAHPIALCAVRWALVVSVVLAAASLAVAAPAPAYDPTAWLLWGREIAGWRLDTSEGPAFKPLPVATCVLLAPLGSAAPWLFVLLARAAALSALPLAFAFARRVTGGSLAAGVLAASAVALCEGAVALGAAGMTEGALVTLALGGLEAWRRGRWRLVVGCAVAASLLRVEAWPLLVAVLALAWRGRWIDRRILAAVAVAVPAAWFVPEALGSGDLLRSGSRARISEPGQPARADVPFLASLRAAAGLAPWPLLAGAAVVLIRARRSQAAVAVATGAVWLVLIAMMAQAGFSGEPRYALPGATLVGIGGAIGIASAFRALSRRAVAPAALLTGALVLVASTPALRDAVRAPARQAHAHALHADLAAVVRAHGRERLLACGRPYVGRLRGPMLAYALDVPRRDVEPDAAPAGHGVVFRSALRAGGAISPQRPSGWDLVARHGTWEIRSSCRATPQV
jgi:hypothetical protein